MSISTAEELADAQDELDDFTGKMFTTISRILQSQPGQSVENAIGISVDAFHLVQFDILATAQKADVRIFESEADLSDLATLKNLLSDSLQTAAQNFARVKIAMVDALQTIFKVLPEAHIEKVTIEKLLLELDAPVPGKITHQPTDKRYLH